MMKIRLTFSVLLTILSVAMYGQYTLNNNTSNLYIDGTSSLHDWTETAEVMSGKMDAVIENGVLKSIKILSVDVTVKEIKSGKSGMDKNTYKALNADKHPKIKFLLKSYKIEGDKVKLTGNLSIAGTTKSITAVCDYEIKGNSVEIEGVRTLKMTEFGVDPPTALMGTITTGDDISIRFNFVFNK